MSFTGLGRSVLGNTVPSGGPRAVLETTGTVFANANLPAGE